MAELDGKTVKRVVEPKLNRSAAQRREGGQRNNGASKTPRWTTNLVSAPLHLSRSGPIFRKTNTGQTAKPPLLLLSLPNFPGENLVRDAALWCICTYTGTSTCVFFPEAFPYTHTFSLYLGPDPPNCSASCCGSARNGFCWAWLLWALVPSSYWGDEGGLCPQPLPQPWPEEARRYSEHMITSFWRYIHWWDQVWLL